MERKHNEEKLCLKPRNFSFFSSVVFSPFVSAFLFFGGNEERKKTISADFKILRCRWRSGWSEFVYFFRSPSLGCALINIYKWCRFTVLNVRWMCFGCVGKFMLYIIAPPPTHAHTIFSLFANDYMTDFPLRSAMRRDARLATARVRCRSVGRSRWRGNVQVQRLIERLNYLKLPSRGWSTSDWSVNSSDMKWNHCRKRFN